MEQEYKYLGLLNKVYSHGKDREDRTGVGTYSLFGEQISFDISNSFPLLTTKKMFFKGIAHELLWFLRGDTNIQYLLENDVHIWDEWANEHGEVGPIYGYQWRSWNGYYDQIQDVIESIKENPYSRRHIVSAWNVSDIKNKRMALPPCHVLFQFYVQDDKLSCHMYQRSADIFLGLPFNIASYALLTYMIGHVTSLQPDTLTISFGDIHLYKNHEEQAVEQLERHPKEFPRLWVDLGVDNINDFEYNSFRLEGYEYHPPIKAEVAV